MKILFVYSDLLSVCSLRHCTQATKIIAPRGIGGDPGDEPLTAQEAIAFLI